MQPVSATVAPRAASTLCSPSPAVYVANVVERVEQALRDLFRAESRRWAGIDPASTGLVDDLAAFTLRGGKRLRPLFCAIGFLAASRDDRVDARADEAVIVAGCALELVHAFALLHDDVMDGSTIRRGAPTEHERLADDHRRRAWRGEPRRYGDGLAVLMGDYAFATAHRLVAGLSDAAGAVWTDLCTELTIGQYLDVDGAARSSTDLERARRVARLKSGRYTVVHPLRLGAAIAGGLAEMEDLCAGYGGPVGEAFQLRDDVLGVFGDPQTTGKPVGEDLREGKPTLLLAEATRRCPSRQRPLLARVGAQDLRDDEIAALQRLFCDCGATDAVEHAIVQSVDAAICAVERADVDERVAALLRTFAERVAWRAT